MYRVQILQPGEQQQAHGVLSMPESLSPGIFRRKQTVFKKPVINLHELF